MEKVEIIEKRAAPNMRIQKREDYAKICIEDRYLRRMKESSNFRKFMMSILKKKVGVVDEMFIRHLEAPNRGYPEGFSDYNTYDWKRNPCNL